MEGEEEEGGEEGEEEEGGEGEARSIPPSLRLLGLTTQRSN